MTNNAYNSPGSVVEGALPPCEEHVGDHPHTPHVSACAGLLAVHHLWRHELYGALELADVHHSAVPQLLSQAKVNNLEAVVRILK